LKKNICAFYREKADKLQAFFVRNVELRVWKQMTGSTRIKCAGLDSRLVANGSGWSAIPGLSTPSPPAQAMFFVLLTRQEKILNLRDMVTTGVTIDA